MKRHLLLSLSLALAVSIHAQNCSDVFISEYVEGTINNKAIELYNPTASPIDLGAGDYKMGRDRNGAGNPMLLPITGIIAPYDVRVFVLDKRDPNGIELEIPVADELQAVADTFLNPVYVEANSPMYFNGDDAFVLVKGTNTILDIIGKIGEDPGDGWAQPGDPFTKWWTTDNTLIRKSTIDGGVTTNPTIFDPSLEWDSLPVNSYENLGTHSCVCGSVGLIEREANQFTVFPNPISRGELSIRSQKEITGYAVFSSSGRLIARKEGLGPQTYYSIALSPSESGLYFMEVHFADGSRGFEKILSR
jgi:hypothetical protein